MTAVEWLQTELKKSIHFYRLIEDLESKSTVLEDDVFQQAKEMEIEQQDEFAIGFAEWFNNLKYDVMRYKTMEEHLEIYKKEKGL